MSAADRFRGSCVLAAGFGLFLALTAGRAAEAQTCRVALSDLAFGAVDGVAGGSVDTSGIVTITCSNLGLVSLLPATVTICPNLDAGSGGSSGGVRLMSGPGGSTLAYQLYQDAGRTQPWGSAGFLQFGAAPTFTVTSNAAGAVNTTRPIYARASPQSSTRSGSYSSTFSGQNIFWGLNLLSCAGLTVGAPAVAPAFNVTATASSSCNLSVSPLNFGARGLLTTGTTAEGAVTVTCTQGTAYTVGLGPGGAGSGPNGRRMTRGSDTIAYGLFRDPGRTQTWGDVQGAWSAGTGSGAAQVLPVYGLVPAQTTPAPGTYTDAVIVTLSY